MADLAGLDTSLLACKGSNFLQNTLARSPSTDADPDLEAQRVEDARLLQFQFSALGQGKRDASRTRPSRSEAKSDARLESSFGVRLKPAASGALDDVSEGSEAEEREEEAKMAGDERSQQQQQQQQQQDNADSNQAGWSRQQQQPPRQDLSSAASSMRASMRGRPSSVQWSMDSRGGPDASVPQQAGLHPDVPPSLHPHLEGAEDVQRAWGGDIGHPELQGVPYAILEALASEPPERERPSIVHTFSMGMGMSARQTGEESLHSLGSRPGEQQGDVASASSSISRPPGSLASNPIWAGAEGHDVAESFKSASIR
ncbi:hypothetical protein DUNSADRAFT_4529 [Dunaliella salina]|uniref:Encoded protein n=1 Tax=Dunaliella salina TaxID=3046 RepID=A0ABQ7GRW3_DUNSA|nr:hypothetical protein DUNSADRAFT_4529 [Dunaliella salina]|eukprot:KAF5837321.1 hypothetical protein DUNSADRAFT_4529 [Dunaliella salina]